MCTRSGGSDTSWTEGVGKCGTYCTDSSNYCQSLCDWIVAMMLVSSGSKAVAGS